MNIIPESNLPTFMKWWTPSKVTAMEKSSQGMFRVCQKRNFYLELDTPKRTSSPVVSS